MAVSTERLTVRLDSESYERAKFWAQRSATESGARFSVNDFVTLAIENEIARRSGMLVDADNMLTGRVNQLTEAVKSMESQLDTVSRVIGTGFDTIISLTRGDNFLMDVMASEDGELDGFGG